jgi:integrase
MVRTGEMRFAKWDEIHEAKKQWRIPVERMKMRREHIVPLSPQVLDILESLKIFRNQTNYIFPALHNDTKPISENAVLHIIKYIGYKGRVTGHGFRSTASTILNEHGFPPDAIERQLAHTGGSSIRAVYNHAEYLKERVKMMNWWSDYLDDFSPSRKLSSSMRPAYQT